MDAREKAIVRAQKDFERDSEKARRARQRAFKKAQGQGYSLAEIGVLVGLSKSRVKQIIENS